MAVEATMMEKEQKIAELIYKYEDLKAGKEIFWLNPGQDKHWTAKDTINVRPDDVKEASNRLKRFAPVIMHYFPETKDAGGIIESELCDIPEMQKQLEVKGRLMLKRDSDLAVAGSVKARGGIHEVLRHAEELAIKEGLINGPDDDYLKLTSEEARAFFKRHKIQVGSTGNLGLSIGIMGSAMGFETIAHMSADARQWKKDLLRSRGVTVCEYEGDYSMAVANGREKSDEDPSSYFVDDEHSVDLFLGYAVAAERLKKQLDEKGISVNSRNPLFVYIPCGVGGAPGGITYGLKLLYGDAVHCFFAEPVQAPCMLLGLASGMHDGICVRDAGLTGITAADGLAVGRCSGLVSRIIEPLLSGEATVSDEKLAVYMRQLWDSEHIFIEPSSCAAFHALIGLHATEDGRKYINDNGLDDKMPDATHIIWATGGSLMPESERGLGEL